MMSTTKSVVYLNPSELVNNFLTEHDVDIGNEPSAKIVILKLQKLLVPLLFEAFGDEIRAEHTMVKNFIDHFERGNNRKTIDERMFFYRTKMYEQSRREAENLEMVIRELKAEVVQQKMEITKLKRQRQATTSNVENDVNNNIENNEGSSHSSPDIQPTPAVDCIDTNLAVDCIDTLPEAQKVESPQDVENSTCYVERVESPNCDRRLMIVHNFRRRDYTLDVKVLNLGIYTVIDYGKDRFRGLERYFTTVRNKVTNEEFKIRTGGELTKYMDERVVQGERFDFEVFDFKCSTDNRKNKDLQVLR
jgi:uncharacterized coiled-coil protein SlyX